MIHRQEEFYERGKKGEICSNLSDPSHRGMNPTARDFCPKGGADSPHLSLRAWDREELKYLHRFLVFVCHPTHTQGYLEEKSYVYRREQTGETWLKHIETLRSNTASRNVAVIHCRGHQKGVQR